MTAPAPLARVLPGSLGNQAGPADPSGQFSWLATASFTWILVGLFVDGWFHIHDPGLEMICC